MPHNNSAQASPSEILVIDDDSFNLKNLSIMLSDAGYAVRAQNSGKLALQSISEKLPDIILLDIQMPGLDGLEVCELLKQDPKTSEIPIIFISGHEASDHKVKAFEAGGVDYITKPFQHIEVLARIKTHLALAKNIIASKRAEAALLLNQKRLESLIAILKTDSKNIQELLDYALKEALNLTESKLGYIYFYSEEKKELTLNTWSQQALPQNTIKKPPTIFPLEKTGLCGDAVRQRKPIVLNDFEGQNPLINGFPHDHAQLQRFLAIPIFSENNIVATIAVANKETDYDQSDVLQLTLLMDSVWKKTESMGDAEQIAMLKLSIDVLREGAYWVDTENKFVYVNDAGCKILGYSKEELIGQSILLVNADATPSILDRVWERLKIHKFYMSESVHRRKDGTEFPVEIRSTYVQFAGKEFNCGIAIDITNRKQTEAALQNSQKLESLGVLAGGIAHDFNNLMGGIFGYIDLAREQCSDKTISGYLSKCMNTIERARALTQQLLTFAKGGAPIQKAGALFPFVQEATHFALSGSQVSCHFAVAENLWACNFDKNQIGQVIDNIVINAQQSMPLGGTIELVAKNVAIDVKQHPTLAAGNYIALSIQDHGVGIPAEMLPKIFDPFFTTKAKGHGLGLATCYSIVHRHGGAIDVESLSGKGSTFHIYLPAVLNLGTEAHSAPQTSHKGFGTVLVMDDENVMLETFSKMLASFGYSVVCKDNGQDAIDFYQAEILANRPPTAVIFDLTVPGGMGGKQAVEIIRKVDATIPVFVASGYADDPVMKDPAQYGFTASICKPFTKTELAEMLSTSMKVRA